ncbi:unnamed protein product [Malus baccata var. baccata]
MGGGGVKISWKNEAYTGVERIRNLDLLWRQEECFWQQRSRVQWLKEGDANTKFFHQSTLHRRRRNKVASVKNSQGNWIENPLQVRRLFDEYFLDLFTSSGQREWGNLLDCVPPKISGEMNESLLAEVSGDEVRVAALQMGSLKAPGPDGFSGIFYQSNWDTVASEVNALIGDLMNGSDIPRGLNATHLVLIPKVQKPESVEQFRPISLCNYSYKMLSKVLANRLKMVIPDLISPSQNAFVAERQIQDNIGIAHELFHFLKTRKARSQFELGIKLDMQKAYDRVEWDFLMAVMEKMGFEDRWRKLILGCISSVNFSILLNGQPGLKFAPSRGLRQGDPLSPYLFLLVSEVLSLLIQQACDRKRIKGVQMNPLGPSISHILFADDTLIFIKDEEVNCRNLIHLIDEFCAASGQHVNKAKSSVCFGSNVPEEVSRHLSNILGFEMVGDPGMYLGVPAIWGRSKKAGLAYVKGRLLDKLQGWKKSTLTQAGREILIKAVAQAIPAYPMNLFKFPSSFCNELDALITKFWWGQKLGENRIHWVSRARLGRPKEEGGLGLRSFSSFNDALLAKQCWRLISEPSTLWARVLKARYFPNCSFLDAKKGGRASWVWASLLAGREILREGRPSPLGSVQVSKKLKVKSLICPESGDWDLDFLKPFLADSEVEAILDLHIGDPTLKDILVWPYEKRGSYSVKSGYYWCINRTIDRRLQSSRAVSIPSTLWKSVWKLKVPPKIRTFMWKTLHEALATMKNLYIRRSSPSPICPLCNSQDESIEHLFLFCPWVEVVWFGGMLNLRPIRQHVSSWASWLMQMGAAENGSAEVRINRISYIAFTCWHIWKSRCEFQFNNQAIYPSRVVDAVSRSVSAYQESTFRQSSPSLLIHSSLGEGVQWSPPNQGVIKINVDASWEARTGEGFTGVVARDKHGRFVAASRHKIKATGATMAEALAIMHGCFMGVSRGWNSICIESDSLDAISCLRDPAKKGNWEAFPILRKCFRMGTAFQACRWSWVPRLANLVANCLASRNCKEVCDLIWVNRPPSSLVHVLCNDGLPCPP